MKRIILAASLVLAGCQTAGQPAPGPIVTLARCSQVVDGANQAGQLVSLLGSLGIAPAKAEALATALHLGSLGVAALCKLLFPAHSTPLPPPVPD